MRRTWRWCTARRARGELAWWSAPTSFTGVWPTEHCTENEGDVKTSNCVYLFQSGEIDSAGGVGVLRFHPDVRLQGCDDPLAAAVHGLLYCTVLYCTVLYCTVGTWTTTPRLSPTRCSTTPSRCTSPASSSTPSPSWAGASRRGSSRWAISYCFHATRHIQIELFN